MYILLLDNLPAHMALGMKHFMVLLEHPLYWLDIAFCDFFFFLKTERDNQGDTF